MEKILSIIVQKRETHFTCITIFYSAIFQARFLIKLQEVESTRA